MIVIFLVNRKNEVGQTEFGGWARMAQVMHSVLCKVVLFIFICNLDDISNVSTDGLRGSFFQATLSATEVLVVLQKRENWKEPLLYNTGVVAPVVF